MPRLRALICTAVFLAGAGAGGGRLLADESVSGCLGMDLNRRIEACTELLARPGLPAADQSVAYSMRALAYSVQQKFDLALPDYDEAIKLDPKSSITRNNRAWAFWKMGTPERGLADAEEALALDAGSPHAYDTRAHIRQSLGEFSKAISDYEKAMLFGGEKLIKLYQCGLQAAGLYKGEADGLYTSKLGQALRLCVKRPNCDPLPPSEDCNFTTS